MAAIDLLILISFLTFTVYSGLRSKKAASKDLDNYFLAGRSLTGWQAGISMAATQFAADTPLLVTGLIATAGIFSVWRLWIYAISFLLVGFLLSASWRRARVLTDAELSELRYSGRAAAILRLLKAVYFGTIFNCTVLAMIFLAATRIAEPFLLWNQWLPHGVFQPIVDLVQFVGVPLTGTSSIGTQMWIYSANNLISIMAIAITTLFYSATGGLRSVVRTDMAQFFLMMAGTALFAGYVVHEVGGLAAIPQRIESLFEFGGPGGILPNEILAFTPSHAKDLSWALIVVLGIQWLVQMNSDGTGYLAQRSMACRSDADAKKAAIIFTIAQVVIRTLLWLPLALGLLIIFPPDSGLSLELLRTEREATYVRGIAEVLPVGIRGILLTAMLAALASSVDTHLNWGASYWTNDIYKRFICKLWLHKKPTPQKLVLVARMSTALILALALVIMANMNSIQTAWYASLLLGASMGVLLVLRWFWWRINAWGEIACILSSIILIPILMWTIPADQEALRLIIMAVVATSAGIVASLAAGPERPSVLKEFFEKTQPPGFWGPVAKAAGEDPSKSFKKLRTGLKATFVGSFSIFCILTGLGSAISGSPPPTWWPLGSLWIIFLLVLGFGLVPVWWRQGFGHKLSLTQLFGLKHHANHKKTNEKTEPSSEESEN